jgi:uncharacterized protein
MRLASPGEIIFTMATGRGVRAMTGRERG